MESLRAILENCKFYTTEWQLRQLSSAMTWYVDVWPQTFIRQSPSQTINLLVVLCQDSATRVIMPCFFGIIPEAGLGLSEVFTGFFKLIKAKSPEMPEPIRIVADYHPPLRQALSISFPSAFVAASFLHRTRLLHNLSKNIKCATLGIKTAALVKMTHYFTAYVMIISLLPKEEFAEKWQNLKKEIDLVAFGDLIAVFERDFVDQEGTYHKELSFSELIEEQWFRVATPALEGYHSRLKQLMKTYNVNTVEMMVDKVLVSEEKHFSSKVAEVKLGRTISPELPEKFFFDKSMGALPVSTMLADIYGMVSCFPVCTLATVIAEHNEDKLPHRKAQTTLINLDNYKANLVSPQRISPEIHQLHRERRQTYKANKPQQQFNGL